MGIKDLCQFLKKKEPDIVEEIPISTLSGQRLAVDASVYLYKFICINNQFKGNWVDMFINFIVWLRKNNIRPVFVFDGKPPRQKERTQKERRAARHRTEQKVLELEDIFDKLNSYDLNELISNELQKRIDDILNQSTEDWPRKEIIREIHEKYKKENSKVIHIGPNETKKIQELLTFLGLPWFQALGEAEKSCAWLCKWNYVKGVITTDSDVLAYGAQIFIQDIKINNETCKMIHYENILKILDLTPLQFLDFCIMCGTDYNERIKGVGPMKAYQLIIKHGNLDNISKLNYNTDILYFNEVRELFTIPEKNCAEKIFLNVDNNNFKIPHLNKIDANSLSMFLFKNNSRFTCKELEQYGYQPKFIIKN